MKRRNIKIRLQFIKASLIASFFSTEYALAAEELVEQSNSQASPDVLLYVVTILSLTFAVISSLVAYKFYSWRQKIDVTGALVPEAWAAVINEQSKQINVLIGHISGLQNKVDETESRVSARLKNLEDETATSIEELSKTQKILMQFQTSLNEKDKAIARYQAGYDFEILKNNLHGIIQLHQNTLKLIQRSPDNTDLGKVEYLIRDTLEQDGISIAKPPLGKSFSDYADKVEVVGHTPEVKGIDSEELKKGDIAEVVSEYYEFSNAERPTILRKAEVKYYLPQE